MIRLVFILIVIMFATIVNTFAVQPQRTTVEGILIESGTSHKDMLPILSFIAGRQQGYFQRKGIFSRIYGQYRGNYILIMLESNGKIKSIEDAEGIGQDTVFQVISTYPSSEGRIEIIPFVESDPWERLTIEFNNGKIIETKLSFGLREKMKNLKNINNNERLTKIFLKNGGTIEGTITMEDETKIWLDFLDGKGKTIINKDEIIKISKQ